MTAYQITPELALAANLEIARRALPKNSPYRRHVGGQSVELDLCFSQNGVTLATWANGGTPPAPKVKAAKVAKGPKVAAEATKVRAPHPMKGKSRLGLTPAQQERRDEILAEIGAGWNYHLACWSEGITTKNTDKITALVAEYTAALVNA